MNDRIPVKIYTFNNGDKLVAANTEERLDIIFLDIIMPLLNGMDAARELRQRDKSVKNHLSDFITGICLRVL